MESKKLFLCFAVFILVLSLFAMVSADDFLALQGNVDEGSKALSSGNLTVVIYDSPSGGSLVYNSSDDFNGAISDGKYDVVLGNGSQSLDLEYGQNYYMELYVNDEKFSFDGDDRQVFQSSVGQINDSFINGVSSIKVDVEDSDGLFNGTNAEEVFREIGSQLGTSSTSQNVNNVSTTWKSPVLDKDLNTPPGSPDDGDRYIISGITDWYNNAWSKRKEINTSSSQISTDETNSIMRFVVSGADSVFSEAQSNGDDILFTNSSGKKLDHDLELFDAGNQRLVATVRIPELQSLNDRQYYMYYNYSESPNMEAENNLFPGEYGLYYEMSNGEDLTTNGRDITSEVGNPSADDGDYGKGIAFDGDDGWSMKDMPYWEKQWNTRTHNVIFETGADVNTRQVLFAEGGSVNGVMLYILNGNLYARWWSESQGWGGANLNTPVSANTVYHATLSYEYPGNYAFYLDGTQIGSAATSAVINAHSGDGGIGYTGRNTKDFHDTTTSGAYFTGTIREFFVTDNAWGENRHDTWNNNRGDNSNFWSVGSQESRIGGATGDWAGREDDLAEYNSTSASWIFDTPSIGWAVYVQDEEVVYNWNGIYWGTYTSGVTHNTLGDLQGGREGPPAEFYHLSEEEHDAATRTANQSQSGLFPSGLFGDILDNSAFRISIKEFGNQSVPFFDSDSQELVQSSGNFFFDLMENRLFVSNITANDSLGIGTTSPSQALDVRGDGNFSGTIYINNNTDVSTFDSGVWENDTGTATYDGSANVTQNLSVGDATIYEEGGDMIFRV